MANYENIMDANNKRTPSERRELARKVGKASGRAWRRMRGTLSLKMHTEGALQLRGVFLATYQFLKYYVYKFSRKGKEK